MRMISRRVFLVFAAAGVGAIGGCATESLKADAAGQPTTIIVVRHANKETSPKDPKDPHLSEAGRKRAERLADALKDAGINAVYVSERVRTRETAEIVLDTLHLDRSMVRPAFPYDEKNEKVAELANRVTGEAGRVVLVVGHSHTLTSLVKQIGGWEIAPILTDEERDFDNVYVITLTPTGGKRLVRLGYPPLPK